MHWSWKCLAIMFVLTILLIAIIIGVKFSCKQMRESNYVEVGRLTSPDSLADAIIVQDKHSNAERGIMVFLEHRGDNILDYDTERFYADPVYELSVHWVNPKTLEIHYTKAQIFKFFNIWSSNQYNFTSGRPKLNTIEIKLIKDGDEELDVLRD